MNLPARRRYLGAGRQAVRVIGLGTERAVDEFLIFLVAVKADIFVLRERLV